MRSSFTQYRDLSRVIGGLDIKANLGRLCGTTEPRSNPRHPAGIDPLAHSQPSAPVTKAQTRLALGVMAAFAAATLAALPFARGFGPFLPGFVPSYQTAVCLLYAISFVHLAANYRHSRSMPLLHVAGGCLFSALILLVQMFSFPIWGPAQIVGSSPATTSWLWTFWHLGPTISVFSYVVARRSFRPDPQNAARPVGREIAWAVVAVLGAVAAATALSTWGVQWLPSIVTGDNYHALTTSGVGPAVLIATLASLGLLVLSTRCATAIELWLAVSLALLAMDDVLTLLGASRLSWGWYAGRAEAAASAAVLLCFCLSQILERLSVISAHATLLASYQTLLSEEIVKQNKANTTLALLARQDGLTLLANRRCFDETIAQEWRRARRDHQPLTLLMIDVDRFKLYNDRFGHQAGDACLQKVAALIQSVCRRPGDLAARYGGEEFALLAQTDKQGGRVMAEALRAALSRSAIPHDASSSGVVTVSIGIASFIPACDDDNINALVAAADQALYRAKTTGRDRIVTVTEDDMADYEMTRALSERDLRLALEREEFELFYQPQVSLTSGRVIAFEALLRWRHPKRGLIMPDSFVPMAESCGLIVPIGNWVLHRACAEAALWADGIGVAVNVSMVQLGDSALIEAAKSALHNAGLSAKRLELEVTETAGMGDFKATYATLTGLRGMGISVAIDDFGCGYSSLVLAGQLPFNHIKVDRAFVTQVGNDDQSILVVRAIKQLATSLGMRTTAEGIETEAQAKSLYNEGIDVAQGYWFGRPTPSSELPALLDRIASHQATWTVRPEPLRELIGG